MDSTRVLLLAMNGEVERFFRRTARHVDVPARVERSRKRCLPALVLPMQVPWKELSEAAGMHLARRSRQAGCRRLPALRGINRAVMWLRVIYRYCASIRRLRRARVAAIAVWNGLRYPENVLALAARRLGLKVLYFELGALPNTLAIDSAGVNFLNSVPRDPAFFRSLPLTHTAPEIRLLERPAAARKASEPARPLPRRFIFAPFQVAADTQIVAFSPWIRDMHEFHAVLGELQARLRRAGSDLEVVVKEHPSCPVNYADLHGQRGVTFANHLPTPELLAKAEAIITINSSVGLEAMLLGKPVITLGQAFYALPGLAASVRGVDQLEAAVLRAEAPDEALVTRFIHWLARDYLVRRFVEPPPKIDRLKTQGGEDWQAIASRLRRLLDA